MNRASAYIDLVLVGGGHAQIQVLKAFAMTPEDGVRLTVITDVLDTPYSGMLPGHIEGLWSAADMHINLVKLARYAGARLIHKSVKDIDLINKTIILEDDLPIRYDVLSLNCGAAPDLHAIPGADRFAVAVKPISRFLEKLPAPADISGPVLLIGAGAAGLNWLLLSGADTGRLLRFILSDGLRIFCRHDRPGLAACWKQHYANIISAFIWVGRSAGSPKQPFILMQTNR